MAGEKPEQKEHWNDWIAKKTGKSESPASRREQKSRNDMQEWSLRQYIYAAPYANRRCGPNYNLLIVFRGFFFLFSPFCTFAQTASVPNSIGALQVVRVAYWYRKQDYWSVALSMKLKYVVFKTSKSSLFDPPYSNTTFQHPNYRHTGQSLLVTSHFYELSAVNFRISVKIGNDIWGRGAGKGGGGADKKPPSPSDL